MLTGAAENADPVCSKSPDRGIVDAAIRQAGLAEPAVHPLVFRSPENSRRLIEPVAAQTEPGSDRLPIC
jgi:pyrroloquinoline quinone biosynthesis protein E